MCVFNVATRKSRPIYVVMYGFHDLSVRELWSRPFLLTAGGLGLLTGEGASPKSEKPELPFTAYRSFPRDSCGTSRSASGGCGLHKVLLLPAGWAGTQAGLAPRPDLGTARWAGRVLWESASDSDGQIAECGGVSSDVQPLRVNRACVSLTSNGTVMNTHISCGKFSFNETSRFFWHPLTMLWSQLYSLPLINYINYF